MRLAVLQMTAVAGDVPGNLGQIDAAMGDAAAKGADLLLAPELALGGYGAGDATAALADPAQIEALAAMARTHGIAVVAGLAERAGDTIYNSAVHTDGGPATIYRKSHLYGEYERDLFAPGPPEAVTFQHRGVTCGLLICYDVEFPENVRRLAQAGADLVLVPTALPAGAYSPFIAGTIIPARAFENQVFVAYANHCGADARFAYAGLSHVAAPDGATLARADTAPTLLIVDIDPAAYAASRVDNPYLHDLRS